MILLVVRLARSLSPGKKIFSCAKSRALDIPFYAKVVEKKSEGKKIACTRDLWLFIRASSSQPPVGARALDYGIVDGSRTVWKKSNDQGSPGRVVGRTRVRGVAISDWIQAWSLYFVIHWAPSGCRMCGELKESDDRQTARAGMPDAMPTRGSEIEAPTVPGGGLFANANLKITNFLKPLATTFHISAGPTPSTCSIYSRGNRKWAPDWTKSRWFS